MPRYVIEREMSGAGNLTPEQLQGASQTSCGVLRELGPEIQWEHSYVTGDKIYCVYTAPSDELIRRHAEQAGFPANRIHEVATIISPATAEGRETIIGPVPAVADFGPDPRQTGQGSGSGT